MSMLSDAKLFLAEWIGAVSRAIDAVAGRVVHARRIRLTEGDDGMFTATTVAAKGRDALPDLSFCVAGGQVRPPLAANWNVAFRRCRVEVQLPPAQVMTDRLDFPARAADFLDGMIRSQIDRLTPWSLDEAAFGFS